MTTTGPSTGAERFVVVPTRPEPLRRPVVPSEWDAEIDAMLDDLFGAPVDEGPGLADVVLVLVGLVSLTAWWARALPLWVLVVAGVCLVLGLVLPVRETWLALRRRRRARALSIGDGVALRVDDASTRRLADAYDRVLDECGHAAVAAPEAADVAHQAVLEVATLLEGAVPTTAAERGYVDERADALVALHRDLVAHRPDRETASSDADVPPEVLRDAAVDALRQLESRTDGGAVARVEALRTAMGRDAS